MKLKLNLIQVLRGFAALFVVLYHTTESTSYYFNYEWKYNLFRIGWCGVDFFFVLSGFIITYIHLKDLKQQKNVKTFLIKRFNRIYPIFWIISAVYFLASVVMKQRTLADFFSPYIIKCFLLIPVPLTLIGAAWSLSFEVAFYLVFALCILLGWRAAKWLAAFWFLAVLVSNVLKIPNLPFLLNGFIIEFLFGGFVGYLFTESLAENKLININYRWLLLAGYLLFIGAWVYFYVLQTPSNWKFSSRFIFGLPSAIIILGSALAEVKSSQRVPSFLLLLGDASYDIYLVHLLVLAVFYKLVSQHIDVANSAARLALFGVLAVSTAVAIGVLIHIYIERPVIKVVNRLLLPKTKTPKNAELAKLDA